MNPFGGSGADENGEQDPQATMNAMAANAMKDYATNIAIGKVRGVYEENKSWLSIDSLKLYFDVTNSYVMHKLKIILFPFLMKESDWSKSKNSDVSDIDDDMGMPQNTPRFNI